MYEKGSSRLHWNCLTLWPHRPLTEKWYARYTTINNYIIETFTLSTTIYPDGCCITLKKIYFYLSPTCFIHQKYAFLGFCCKTWDFQLQKVYFYLYHDLYFIYVLFVCFYEITVFDYFAQTHNVVVILVVFTIPNKLLFSWPFWVNLDSYIAPGLRDLARWSIFKLLPP